MTFNGEYRHNLDAKKRLVIPAKFRALLGDTLVLAAGEGGCIAVYTPDAWNELCARLEQIPYTDKAGMRYRRAISSSAADVSCDSMSRVQLTPGLIKYAGLNKNCLIIGNVGRVEIWDEDRWNSYIGDQQDSIDSYGA